MIDMSVLRLNIYNWAVAVSGIECFWVYDNAPKPDTPCISMQVINLSSRNLANEHPVDEVTGLRTIVKNYEIWLKLDAYGVNAMGQLSKFLIANEDDTLADPLRSNGLSMVDNTIIEDLSGLLDINNEERATVNLKFTYGDVTENISAGVIETVEGTGTLKTGFDGVDRTFDYSITTP